MSATAKIPSLEDLRCQTAAAHRKAIEDAKLIPDWDEATAAALADPNWPVYRLEDHPYLIGRIAISDVKALLSYYLAKYPAEMKKLLELTPNLDRQAQFFSRLEGKVEVLWEIGALVSYCRDKAEPVSRPN